MAFSEEEISQHLERIENEFWAKRRPPLALRGQIREGQRITDQAIVFYFERPAFRRPGEFLEHPFAKLRFVRTRKIWELYWQRADLKFHRYDPCPEVETLSEALAVIDEDAFGCFFG